MNPKRKELIQGKLTLRVEVEREAKQLQAAVGKAHDPASKLISQWPYEKGTAHRGDLEAEFAAICQHDYSKHADFWSDGRRVDWITKLTPFMDALREAKTKAREGWRALAELDKEIDGLVSEVQDNFTAEFNAVLPPLHDYLVAIYQPFVTAGTEWERKAELDGLISITPLFQNLLLLRKQGSNGSTSHGQISSMFSALSRLNHFRDAVTAAMNPKLPGQ